MNSLSDILNKKADDLFQTPTPNPSDDENKEDTLTENTPEENTEPDTGISEFDPSTSATPDNDDQKINIAELKNAIYKMKDQLDTMLRAINGETVKQATAQNPDIENLSTGEKIIEGVFNGEKMIGSDGKEYSIPPNYASKSKLVEGDMMKLTITNNGSFIYKQIQPIERKRVTGELVSDPATGQWSVLADGRTYKILTASITFFKGKAGDEAIILIPQDGESDWGAVENVINK